MTPVLIIGGLFVLWRVLVYQQASILADTPPPSSGVTVSGEPVDVGTSNPLQTDSAVMTGFTDAAKATAAVPVVGQVIAGLASIAGLFTSSHAAAVKQESQVLSGAAPQFVSTVEQIMAAVNQGMMTPAQATAALDKAQTDYYSAVSSIIKKSGSCKPPTYAQTNTDPTKCFIYGGTQFWKDCATGSDCNAACGVACSLVEPTVASLKRIIQQGSGTYVIPAFSPAASSLVGAATPQVTIVYKPYAVPQPESLGTIFLHDIGL
jgi:hypothetical protein